MEINLDLSKNPVKLDLSEKELQMLRQVFSDDFPYVPMKEDMEIINQLIYKELIKPSSNSNCWYSSTYLGKMVLVTRGLENLFGKGLTT